MFCEVVGCSNVRDLTNVKSMVNMVVEMTPHISYIFLYVEHFETLLDKCSIYKVLYFNYYYHYYITHFIRTTGSCLRVITNNYEHLKSVCNLLGVRCHTGKIADRLTIKRRLPKQSRSFSCNGLQTHCCDRQAGCCHSSNFDC